jgi:AcrR family transcriptional regulator
MSADERREAVLEAAMREFALGGLHGTSAEVIAARAGISQPYLFRLFGTKKELFLAVVDRVFDRMLSALQEAAEGPGSTATVGSLNRAYAAILGDREALLAQIQVFAACSDDEIRFHVRRRFAECYRCVESALDGSEDEVRAFFANGMLQTVAAAMRLDELAGREPWARRLITPRE